MKSLFAVVLLAAVFVPGRVASAGQFLFDATKAEMAGNADWVIDADSHNLSVSSSSDGSGKIGGTESNPQRIPTAGITSIAASTAETYWTGALSSWGVSLAQIGATSIETLPYNGAITYGNASNPQDLSNYKVFTLVEPNILFTAAEKVAILTFVANGGGLFLVADHNASDRNNDGEDSVAVINDLFTNNTVKTNPFGVAINLNSLTPSSPFVDTKTTDPLTNGKAGTVTSFTYNVGATLTIDPTKNASVTAAVWASSSKGNANVMVAYGTYGKGRFVVIGDSSPFDDGTGDSKDTLYDGWNEADNAALITNASLYLAAIPEPGTLALLCVAGAFIVRPLARRRLYSKTSKPDAKSARLGQVGGGEIEKRLPVAGQNPVPAPVK